MSYFGKYLGSRTPLTRAPSHPRMLTCTGTSLEAELNNQPIEAAQGSIERRTGARDKPRDALLFLPLLVAAAHRPRRPAASHWTLAPLAATSAARSRRCSRAFAQMGDVELGERYAVRHLEITKEQKTLLTHNSVKDSVAPLCQEVGDDFNTETRKSYKPWDNRRRSFAAASCTG